MNIKDLIYFCDVVESGSFSFAARKHQVTQPTISLAIKRLSTQYDDPLIKQKNRKGKIYLTPAGEVLYKKGQNLIKDINSINYDVNHAKYKKIRFAFSGEAGSKYIPEIIQQFVEQDIIDLLEPRIERSADIFEDLTNGDVDVAVYSWMVPINDPNYFIRNLDKTDLVIITSTRHPLANRDYINATELRNQKFIARDRGYLTRESLKQVSSLANFTPNIIFTATTMKLMLDLVERNVGIALAMESSLENYLNRDKLHVIHLYPNQTIHAYMQIAMRKSFIPNKYQKPGIDIFRNFHRINH